MRALRYPLVAIALAACLACLVGCAAGTVTTSTGQVVPAVTVQIQDSAADILKSLDDAYKDAVATHDSLVGSDTAVTHAAHRATLLNMHAGLVASWDALIAWKGASNGAPPPNILSSVVTAARDFVPLAVQLGAIKPEVATSIMKYLNAFFPLGGAQ